MRLVLPRLSMVTEGSSTLNVIPAPSRESTIIDPPLARTTSAGVKPKTDTALLGGRKWMEAFLQ